MSNRQLTTTTYAATIESVVIGGDLSRLDAAQRVNYYQSVCKSLGLNPLTRPFDYITLNGKLTLYAKKDAADQLRKINGVSIGKPDIQFQDDLILVTVAAHDKGGREDSDVGIVKKSDMRGDVANAIMKAVTKAKRRVTLSLCGLGWLDETEAETIPDARPVKVTDAGEIVDAVPSHTETKATNGNGHKPEPSEHAALFEEWKSVFQTARQLGVKLNGLAQDAPDDVIRARISDAKAKIAAASQPQEA